MKLRRRRELSPRDVAVLIVDDERDIRAVVRSHLEDFGFIEIKEAASGEEALHMVHQNRPDLIVLDYMMSAMNGETVAPFLRVLAPNAAIVAFSGVLRFHPDWADDFVDKLAISELSRVCFEAVRSIQGLHIATSV
ncbi:MAG: two-component system, OmpR family, sensor kinase [Actinomycetota bacterium]|jgi:PleD family two-component response regulator|nr:two-component system, OmpR family, sensor kinase [Actinomycetota bacterium]